MRLKAFSAPTMALAMAQVRTDLGENAIIVSTRAGGRAQGVTVMAALEETASGSCPAAESGQGDPLDAMDGILSFHRVPAAVADSLLAIAESFEADTATALLAGALDARFRFQPTPLGACRAIVLIGAAGAGKTVAAAKLAAVGLLAGHPVRLINADISRAGGGERLKALANRLDLPIDSAADPSALRACLTASGMELVVVDTPGINPLDDGEVSELRCLLAGIDATRIMVMPAGGDAMECADQALAFSALSAEGLIVTRLDAAIRYGGALTAAHAAGIPFSGAGIQPQIGNGLTALNPMSLARILAARCDGRSAPLGDPERAA